MKKLVPLVTLLMFPLVVIAQFSVVSIDPVNNAKNVPLSTTISITFSEALDTNAMNNNGNETWFSNIDSVISSGFSPDLKTTFSIVALKPNQAYFIAFIYIKALSGAVITSPQTYYFTTGAEFPPYSVSGTVLSGQSGVSAEGAVVGLSAEDIFSSEGDGPPPFVGWANVNTNGTFTIPNIANGTYWILSVKDVDHDGVLNVENGVDVIAFGDSLVVNNAPVSNINLTFTTFAPKILHDVIAAADSIANSNLPGDKVLRRISGYDIDTLGRSRGWEFIYTYNNGTEGKGVRIGNPDIKIYPLDQNYIDWIKQLKPVTNYQTAASSVTVINNVENAGGKAFRLAPHADSLEVRIEFSISDQVNGWFWQGGFDTSKIYWAVAYTLFYQATRDSSVWIDSKYFLCDLATGAVILAQPTRVDEATNIPKQFSLSQNYPNPFNPSTTIRFTIPSSNVTTLRIFDLLGKEVAVLVNEQKDAGAYSLSFDAARLPSGIYFYQLRSGNFVETKKMILMK